MAIREEMVTFSYEGQSIGFPSSTQVSVHTLARFFQVQTGGFHVKIIRNGRLINVWPDSGGRLKLPDGCEKAEVIAFAEEENDFRFDEEKTGPSKRAQQLAFPRIGQIRNFSATSNTGLSSKGKGKRPAPGYSFVSEKKKSITKNIALSDLGSDGNLYELFPIIINLTEIQCGEISVDTVKLVAEDQLAQCGKIAPLIILDKKGNPIQDMPHSRGLGFWGSQKVFRAMDISVFKIWKPEVWNVIVNGIPNLCSDDEDDDKRVTPLTISKPTSSKDDKYEDILIRLEKLEKQQSASNMQSRISNAKLVEKKKITEVFSCSICLGALKFPVVVDKQCKRIIGCSICIDKLEDSVCPLCRAPLDDENSTELIIPDLEPLLEKEDSDHEFDFPAF